MNETRVGARGAVGVGRVAAVLVLFLGVLLAGCGNDNPTSVGAPLIPGGDVRTFQITLDAPEFLMADTSVTGFVVPGQSSLMVVAHQFDDSLESHALLSLLPAPTSVTYPDTTGATHVDTIPHWTGADIVVVVDSASVGPGPAQIELSRVGESWDPLTASWDARVDSTGDHRSWTQAGGTVVQQLGTETWTPGTDTLTFHVDSQTVVTLRDTTAAYDGLMLSTTTPGVRLETRQVSIVYNAIPSPRPDTTVTASVGPRNTTFVYSPALAPGPELRVAGLPTWRAVLEFKPGLDTLTLPCPGEPGCFIPVNKATVTAADLMLQPLPPQAGFRPEEPVTMDVRTVFRSPLIPVSRSPLGNSVAQSPPVPMSSFQTAGAQRVPVPIGSFVTSLLGSTSVDSTASPETLALLPFQTHDIFGVGTFGSLASGSSAPQLRLVLTIAQEALIR